MDRIFICDLRVNAIIGVYPAEKERRQLLILNVEIETDFSRAAASDDLSDAVDYSAVETEIVSLVSSARFQLLESLADAVCRLVKNRSGVTRVTVTIEKPGAARYARAIAVRHSL